MYINDNILILCYFLIIALHLNSRTYDGPIKPNPLREGDGKRRVFEDQDGRAAEGSTCGMLGFLFYYQSLQFMPTNEEGETI